VLRNNDAGPWGTREMVPLRSTPVGGGWGFGAVVLAGALARGGDTKEKLGIDFAIEDGLCTYGGHATLVSGRACACVVCLLWSLNPEHRHVVVKLPLHTRDRSNQTISADRQPFASLAPLCQNPDCLHPLPWSASLPFELCTRNLHMILVLHVLMLCILFRFDKE
jgi:hypothetical protein